MEIEVFSERSAHKVQKPGNSPKEIIQLYENDKSLKSVYDIVRRTQVDMR